MPLGPYQKAKKNVREKMNPDYIAEKTSIYSDPIGDPPLDPRTILHIKTQFRIWYGSWIADDLTLITQ